MQVAISSTVKLSVSHQRLTDFVKCVQGVVRFPKEYELSIALVGPATMKRFNQSYRGKVHPTNVLSFAYDNRHGEVVLCPNVIKLQAKAKKVSFLEELLYLLSHGLLHLKGMDHEGSERKALKMEALEAKLMQVCYR